MKNNFFKIEFLVFVLLLFCYSCKKEILDPGDINFDEITITQGENRELIKDYKIISLKKKAFSIEFYDREFSKEDAYGRFFMAFSLDKNAFTCYNINDSFNHHTYFKEGHSVACGIPCKSVFICNDSFKANYTVYYGKNRQQRAKLLNEYTNDFLQLEYIIENFHKEDEMKKIADSDVKMLYGAIIADKNSNRIIDKNELKRFAFNFERPKDDNNENFMKIPSCDLFKIELLKDEYSGEESIKISNCNANKEQIDFDPDSDPKLADFEDFNGDGKEDVLINNGFCGTGGCVYSIYLKEYDNYYKLAHSSYLKNIQYKKDKNGTITIISKEEPSYYEEPGEVHTTIRKFNKKLSSYSIDTTYVYEFGKDDPYDSNYYPYYNE